MYTIYQTINFNHGFDFFVYQDKTYYYALKGDTVVLRTRMMNIADFDNMFINFVFDQFPACSKIMFDRIDINLANDTKNNGIIISNSHKCLYKLGTPSNQLLLLPETLDEYVASLGKKTRQHLKWYQRQLYKEFSESKVEYVIEDILHAKKETVASIVRLIHDRRTNKGLSCETDSDQVYDQLSGYNVNIYLKINDEIVAGTVSSVYNGALNLHNISHNDAFSNYNVGNLILLKTIEYAIENHIKIFNFLWGECDYKKRFGAEEQRLYDVYHYKNVRDFHKYDISLKVENVLNNIKKVPKSILHFSYSATRWLYHHTLKRPQKSLGYILMLHRVDELEERHLWCNEHMKVTPRFLDEQIMALKQHYDIIPLTEVPQRLRQKNERPFIVFTMDDGYKDNYTKALPVFKKHNVPYTIFVTTDFPDKKAILWWYELEDLLLNNKSLTLANGVTYPSGNYKEQCESFLRIREEILKLNQLDLENELNRLFNNYVIDWKSKCEKLCLSWDDIQLLKKEPLVTIGAHTQHHYNLKHLVSAEEVRNEVLTGVQFLKEKAGVITDVFAYPYGSSSEAGKREYRILAKMPFICSCIADGGACTRHDVKHLSALPRIMFHHGFTMKDLR